MEIEDVGLNPQRLAEAIHRQMGEHPGPVPVCEIALALDIDEIRAEPLTNLEAALVTTAERDRGKILLNSTSSVKRRRFSLSHELLHFLNQTHEQTAADGFYCTRKDMLASKITQDRHVRQESEANTFAIELLTPRHRLKPFLKGAPDLAKVVSVAAEFEISREASARRFVELHPDDLAVVFCKDSRFTYADNGKGFPPLSIRRGDQCNLGKPAESTVSDFDEVAADDWLVAVGHSCELSIQTLWQANGHSITLLRSVTADEDDDPGFEDAFERFSGGKNR